MGRRKVSYEELIFDRRFESYSDEVIYIKDLISAGKITPIKNSGTNGKKPTMHRRYWLNMEDRDYTEFLDEIKYRLSPHIKIDYYRTHPEIYAREREQVIKLDDYLRERGEELKVTISKNERSFAIWGREKFLSGETVEENNHKISASDILRHSGITMDMLNVYDTNEPFAYYSKDKDTPQNILILENLDPFYGMRKYLMDGGASILGVRINTLIYGGGKRILSLFENFVLFAEDHVKFPANRFFYFGDLDYEGIGIYERFSERMRGTMEVVPFVEAYLALMKDVKAEDMPETKEHQNRNIGDGFFKWFDAECVKDMKSLLELGRYIPQEKLTVMSYRGTDAV